MPPDGERHRFPGALGGTVTMELGDVAPQGAEHVLAVARCGRLWLFTRHRERGLELPGGKLHPGEPPLAGLGRELYEETGAVVWRRPRPIARYRVQTADRVFAKLVFTVEVGVLLEPPRVGDGIGRELLVPPAPESVRNSNAFSPLLKDGVCPLLYRSLNAGPDGAAGSEAGGKPGTGPGCE